MAVMQQSALAFDSPCRVPSPIRPTARKSLRVLCALEAGQSLTVGVSVRELGVYALSQECGRLRRLHWPIVSRRIETTPGVYVSQYRIDTLNSAP